jgi:hypothetical protein
MLLPSRWFAVLGLKFCLSDVQDRLDTFRGDVSRRISVRDLSTSPTR